MPARKHKIPKSDARKLAKEFKKKKDEGNETIRNIPDGFLFKADEVRELLSHSEAVSFVIRFGWKKTKMGNGTEKEIICPILVVLDSHGKIIEGSTLSEEDGAMAMATRDGGESGGGYLDEGDPIPPPQVDFDD